MNTSVRKLKKPYLGVNEKWTFHNGCFQKGVNMPKGVPFHRSLRPEGPNLIFYTKCLFIVLPYLNNLLGKTDRMNQIRGHLRVKPTLSHNLDLA